MRATTRPALDDVRVEPDRVHALLVLATPDDPSGLSVVRPPAQWREQEWEHPDHDPAAGTAAWDGEDLVAATLVDTDRAAGRLWSGMSATQAWTGNASDNAPMLAVNRWLGYEVAARGWVVHGGDA